MSQIIVNGNKKLSGEITIGGAKNSVLPVLAGTLLCAGECVIHNCPNISDVDAALKILEALGCKYKREKDNVVVDSTAVSDYKIPDNLMREMRSSVMFLGAIIGRMGKAVISSPGGCELGPRPIDLHLSALGRLGVRINEEHGYLYCDVPKGLSANEIHLGFPSVGATENIILTAVKAQGTTIIHNAAKEPEISDLADFLNSAGAKIYGCGSDTICIEGVERLHGTEHTIIPDRIVASTYISAAAVTGSEIVLNNIMPSQMVACLSLFEESGCDISVYNKTLKVKAPVRPRRISTVRSLVYPGFPTDAGPLVISMLALADGTSVFIENIFENRFRYVGELNRLGAKIKTQGKTAIIEGVTSFTGASCNCTDLRGGAALVVAALAAKGETVIGDISHIMRGYDDIVGDLSALGADIKIV